MVSTRTANAEGAAMSERRRMLRRAISRGLKLITAAIDQYAGEKEPAAPGRR